MRALAELTAAAPAVPGGPPRLTLLRSAPPLSWRPTPDAVYLVGSAASPVGDDEVCVRVEVGQGAVLRVRSAAATVAWAAGSGTRQHISVRVAAGAGLDWRLEPLIATAGCAHCQHVTLELAAGGWLRFTEEVVLGRHGEGPGALRLRLDASMGDMALLRHALVVGPDGPGWDGPAVLGDYRALGATLVAGGPLAPSPAPPAGAGEAGGGRWAVLPLQGPGVLALAAGADLPAAREALAAAVKRIDEQGGAGMIRK